MKSLGIVRKVDELGRIVLPIEIRRGMGLDARDAVEIFVDGESVILKKYAPSCVFCGDAGDVVFYMDKRVCRDCLRKLLDME